MKQLKNLPKALGGEKSMKSTDLDDTLPYEVDGGALRSSTSGVRYRATNNDLDDIELDDDETAAQ